MIDIYVFTQLYGNKQRENGTWTCFVFTHTPTHKLVHRVFRVPTLQRKLISRIKQYWASWSIWIWLLFLLLFVCSYYFWRKGLLSCTHKLYTNLSEQRYVYKNLFLLCLGSWAILFAMLCVIRKTYKLISWLKMCQE